MDEAKLHRNLRLYRIFHAEKLFKEIEISQQCIKNNQLFVFFWLQVFEQSCLLFISELIYTCIYPFQFLFYETIIFDLMILIPTQ